VRGGGVLACLLGMAHAAAFAKQKENKLFYVSLFAAPLLLLLLGPIGAPSSAVVLARNGYEAAHVDALTHHMGSLDLIKKLTLPEIGDPDEDARTAFAKLLNETSRIEEGAVATAQIAADVIAEDELRVANKGKVVVTTELAKERAEQHGEKSDKAKTSAAHKEAVKNLEDAKQGAKEGLRLKKTTFDSWVDAVNTTAKTSEELVLASEAMVARADERIEALQIAIRQLQQHSERMQATRAALAVGVKGAQEQAKTMRARADTAQTDGLPPVSAAATASATTTTPTEVDKERPPPKDEP